MRGPGVEANIMQGQRLHHAARLGHPLFTLLLVKLCFFLDDPLPIVWPHMYVMIKLFVCMVLSALIRERIRSLGAPPLPVCRSHKNSSSAPFSLYF